MQLWQALFLGVLQGVSELFPVSSLAQTILIPALLRWQFDREAKDFLAFVVALHLATAVALVIYFWKDWIKVIVAFLGIPKHGKLVYDRDSKFAWLLVAGTVVVGFMGLVLEKHLRLFFEDPSYVWVVALFLILNGGVMLYGDYMKRKAARDSAQPEHEPRENHPDDVMVAALTGGSFEPGAAAAKTGRYTKHAEDLTFSEGALVGAAQTLALLPGISRSGVTIVGGLYAGLTYEQASRFSFMLATPVIGLAALLKVPELLKPEGRGILKMAIPASIVAGVAAYLSTKFLMKYFQDHRLSPFAYYCIIFGAICLVFIKH